MSSTAVSTASNAIKAAVDFLMPVACVHCGVEGAFLCGPCVKGAESLPKNLCRTCAEPTAEHMTQCGDCATLPPPLDRLVAVYRYRGAVRSAVHALKYRHITAIAPVMAGLMSTRGVPKRSKFDCALPVPVHSDRLRERGYNQAAFLARHVAENSQMQFIADGLRKTRSTLSQVELTRQERATSLKNAFAANYHFEDAHVLLIDDVCTTGNTLMNCAAALKRAGASRVTGMVFAKETLDVGELGDEQPLDFKPAAP